jgi:hypothetical protein
MFGRFRPWVPLLLALMIVGPAAPVEARPCIWPHERPTLTDEVGQASIVLIGSVAGADEPSQTTDFRVEAFIKDREQRVRSKTVKLTRYLEPSRDKVRPRYLVYLDVHTDKNKVFIDPYRKVLLKPDSRVPE